MLFLSIQVPQAEVEGNRFATSIAAGRDLDGDCIPDLVIGDETPTEGVEAWFVSGKDGSVLARYERRGRPASLSVDLLGDLDGDETSEVAVSVSHDSVQPGSTDIVSGRLGMTLWRLRGEDFGLEEGFVRAAGNFDGDRSRDLVVVGRRPIERYHTAGSVLLVSGRSGSVLWGIDSERIRGWKFLGMRVASVATVGDVDGDDRDDVAIAWAVTEGRSTRVSLHSGSTGLLLYELAGAASESRFGYSLDGGADVDGDGRPDILVGSPWSASGGRVRFYSGRDGKLLRLLDVAKLDPTLVDMKLSDPIGECVRFVEDVDGDGVPEVFIGSPEEGIVGAAYLRSGRTGAKLFAIRGDGDYLFEGHIGRALSAAGDVDQDGAEDVVVCSVPCGGAEYGLVRVISGRSGRLLLRLDRGSLLRAKVPRLTPR